MTTLKSRATKSSSAYRTATGRKRRRSQRTLERYKAHWWRTFVNQRARRQGFRRFCDL